MARFSVRIDVTHKPGILDPQGAQIERSLPALGWTNVSSVEVGKSIHLTLEAASETAARQQVDEMCARLLTNPVLEEYEADVVAAPAEEGAA